MMQKQIEERLHCLIGLDLWGAGRTLNLLSFQFGPRRQRTDRYGKVYDVGTYALHVLCSWHLATAHCLIAASGDRGYEPQYADGAIGATGEERYTWARTESSLLDERLLHFFRQCEQTPLLVQALRADDLGGLTIDLSSHHQLTVFPDTSCDEEYWRFFQVGVDLPHFVVTCRGIEEQ